jgi:hypothetical protein
LGLDLGLVDRRDLTALAIAGLAACAGMVVASDLMHRRSPASAAIDTGRRHADYEDPDLDADERAAGVLWARDHPGRQCPVSDDAFTAGCEIERRALP